MMMLRKRTDWVSDLAQKTALLLGFFILLLGVCRDVVAALRLLCGLLRGLLFLVGHDVLLSQYQTVDVKRCE